MGKDRGEYTIPLKCKKCGSNKIHIRVLFDIGMVRYVCDECNDSNAIPKIENLNRRTNTPLENWSIQVRKKYGAKCAICGSENDIEAHHIIPVSHSRKYMLSLDNGIALCKQCHWLVHNYESEDGENCEP